MTGKIYMRMLDLCCGLKGASAAMQERGWQVISVDINKRFNPTILADVRFLKLKGNFDLIWASPPCLDYTDAFRVPKNPDLSIWRACLEIIEDLKPQFWVIENVRGAQKFWGRAQKKCGSYYLWGSFPIFDVKKTWRDKSKYSSKNDALRAKIPYSISLTLAKSIELVCKLEITGGKNEVKVRSR